MICRHLRAHDVHSSVEFLEAERRFSLIVRVVCADCQAPFEFATGVEEAELTLTPPRVAPIVAGRYAEKRN